MLESHKLLQAWNYTVRIAFDAKRSWTTLLVILDPGADPNLIMEQVVITAWTPLLRLVKTICLRLAPNNLMEPRRIINQNVQIEQLQEKVRLLAVPGLVTNMLQGTALSVDASNRFPQKQVRQHRKLELGCNCRSSQGSFSQGRRKGKTLRSSRGAICDRSISATTSDEKNVCTSQGVSWGDSCSREPQQFSK